jgi:hypothetical protein
VSRRELGKDLGVAALLAAAVLIFFWRAALLQGTFFVQDVMVQNYPFRDFFSRALKDLSLPLWSSEINYGFPLFAEGQAGVFYFFNLLTAISLPTFVALNYNLIFHFWLAAVGGYAFLRSIGCLRLAALSGALIYSCSGFLVVRAMSFNYLDVCAWMPVFFLLVEWAVRRNRLIYLLLAAVVVGLQFLAGHPQATVSAAGGGILYGIYRGVEQRCGWKFWALLLGGPLLGAGLAAIQLVPTAELVGLSARSEGVGINRFVSMSLPPERLITFLLPNFFGNSSTGSYWGRDAGFYIQLCGYMGVLPVLLSLVALKERRDGYSGFFFAFCGLALVLVLGRFTPIYETFYHIPVLNYFRIPTRFLQWLAFGMAVLSGLGLDRVLRARPGEIHRDRLYFCGILALLAGAMAWLNREVIFAKAAALQQKWGSGMVQYQQDLQIDLWRCGLMLGLGGLVLVQRGGGRKKCLAIGVAAALLVYGDLYHFGRSFNGVIPSVVYEKTPESAAFILRDLGGESADRPRVLSLINEKNSPYDWHGGWALDQSSYRQYPQTLRYYTGSMYGLANVLPGWSPLHLERHLEFTQGYPAIMPLAGINYVVSYQAVELPGLELVFEDGVKVYRHTKALPHAYLVGDYRVVKDPKKRLHYLKSRGFDPRRQVLLEEEPGSRFAPGRQSAGEEVKIVSYRSEEVQIQLGDHQGGFLVLSDTYYPGWKAYVDGQEQHILQANHVFRAVEVPQGARQVVFNYKPDSFVQGAWMSAGTLVIWVLLVFWGRGHPCWKKARSVETAAHGFKVWTLQFMLIVLIHALVTQWSLWAQLLHRSRVFSMWGGG